MNTHDDPGALVAAEHGIKRSARWPAVEHRFLSMHPVCACGGGKKKLNVHHAIIPFHFAILLGRPDLELDPRNLITLSADPSDQYHVLIGHLDNYQSFNPDVLMDVRRYHGWTIAQIKSDAVWLHKKAVRPKVWKELSEREKQELAERMNHFLPLVVPQRKGIAA